jgi:aminomethyltransferase
MLDVDYFSSHHALIEDQKSSPLEINLGWTVSADKGPYTGRRAIRAEKDRGPAWAFVGIDVDWLSLEKAYAERDLPPQLPTIAWRGSAPLHRNGSQIGYATSGCWSPLLKKYLALAHVGSPHAQPGTRVEIELTVEHRRRRIDATVSKLPFFDPARKRA